MTPPAHAPARPLWTWRAALRAHWECALIILLYLTQRLGLLTARGLASDEVFTIHEMAAWPFQRLVDSYYFVVLQSLCLSGWTLHGTVTREAWLRLLPVGLGLGGLLGLYVLVRRYFGRLAALLAMVTFCCAHFQIAYSLYVRFYSLQMTLVIWLIYAWLRWVERPAWRWLAWWAGLGGLACMAHPYSGMLGLVLVLHFVVVAWLEWPLWRRSQLARWQLWSAAIGAVVLVGLAVLVWSDRAVLLARAPFGTGVHWVQAGGWLPGSWHALQAFVCTNLLQGSLVAPVFSFGLCGAALVITLGVRMRRRTAPLVELLLVLYALVPALVFAHLQSTHTFGIRYLAFWFPAWVIITASFGAVVECVLQRWRGTLFILELALLGVAFATANPRAAVAPDDEQNRAVVDWIETHAGTNPVVLITTAAMFNKHEVVPEYLYDVRQHAGEWLCDAHTVARRGISGIGMPPTQVVWLRAFGGLNAGADFASMRTGFYAVATRMTTYSNWHAVLTDTLCVMPETSPVAADAPATLCIDAGTPAAHPYLWNGWSHDEQWSPEMNCVWGEGTDLWLRLPGLAWSNYWLCLRWKALQSTPVQLFLGGQAVATVCVSDGWATSMLSLPRAAIAVATNDILRLQPARCAVPGRVAPRVLEMRALSVCLDWLRLVPVGAFPTNQRTYAARYVPAPLPVIRAATPQPWRIELVNQGTLVWPCAAPNPVRLGVRWLDAAHAEIAGQRLWLPQDVYPGQSVTLACTLTPPATPGVYTVQLDAVHENVTWFSAHGPAWQTNVTVALP